MSLRHAALGFLSLRPLTGYDLKKYFDASVGQFWSADQAQIYRALTQLVADALVEVEVIEQDGRPNRREHRITAAGLSELDDWLREPLAPQPTREPFLVKLFFAGRLPAAEVAGLLDVRIAAVRAYLAVLGDVAVGTLAAGGARSPTLERVLTTATVENGLRHVRAELDWLCDLRGDLDDLPNAASRLRQRFTEIHPRGEQT
jgi:DNA-binding PadR family transcriptional regulator